MPPRALRRSLVVLLLLPLVACPGSRSSPNIVANDRPSSRSYRAIAGISMGAFGALNIGTKRPEWFGQVAALGGPISMRTLLDQIETDNLDVRAPGGAGNRPSFDEQRSYPGRNVRLSMIKDLVLCFGNPFLHHPDPTRRLFAVHSEPAQIGQDDRWGAFLLPLDPRGFADAGDANRDGLRQLTEAPDAPSDVLLAARGSLAGILQANGTPNAQQTNVGDRSLADLDGDGTYDVGDGLVTNFCEPFVDANGDGVWSAGESFDDLGLDGVAGTNDLGEGNGQFDEDPDIATWLDEDPVTRVRGMDLQRLAAQRIYGDVGSGDSFDLTRHYEDLVEALTDRGLPVVARTGLLGSCATVPRYPADRVIVRYPGDHIGIPEADDILETLLVGDFCGAAVAWNRLLDMLGFLDSGFEGGLYGTQGIRRTGSTNLIPVDCPTLTPAGAETVVRRVLVYFPPAWFNTNERLPVVYFFGGYGQDPTDYQRFGLLMDLLINSDEVQNMVFVFVPGRGGYKGSFYADQVLADEALDALGQGASPDILPTTGRFESAFLEDILPEVEDRVLGGRVKR